MTEIKAFSIADIREIGSGLNRPECVLAAGDGRLYSGDWTLGIAEIAPDGSVKKAVADDLIGKGFLPNGIALTSDGSFLFANLGEAGGVWEVGRTGEARPFLTEVEGHKIPPANFVLCDGPRVWVTVSASTRSHAYFSAEEKTGQIILCEDGKARVVADRLTWTNELRITPDRRHLFVNETFAGRTTRYDLAPNGDLSNPVRTSYPAGTFPDGLAVDAEGCLWSACVVSNRLLRIRPDGEWTIIFEDADPGEIAAIGKAHQAGKMTRDMIVQSHGKRVSNLSSIAFGGPDLRTIYLGGLTNTAIMVLDSPVAGQPMDHWI